MAKKNQNVKPNFWTFSKMWLSQSTWMKRDVNIGQSDTSPAVSLTEDKNDGEKEENFPEFNSSFSMCPWTVFKCAAQKGAFIPKDEVYCAKILSRVSAHHVQVVMSASWLTNIANPMRNLSWDTKVLKATGVHFRKTNKIIINRQVLNASSKKRTENSLCKVWNMKVQYFQNDVHSSSKEDRNWRLKRRRFLDRGSR